MEAHAVFAVLAVLLTTSPWQHWKSKPFSFHSQGSKNLSQLKLAPSGISDFWTWIVLSDIPWIAIWNIALTSYNADWKMLFISNIGMLDLVLLLSIYQASENSDFPGQTCMKSHPGLYWKSSKKIKVF